MPLSWDRTGCSWKSGQAGCQLAASLPSCDLSRSCWQCLGHMHLFPSPCTRTSVPHGFAATAHKNKTSKMRKARSICMNLSESGLARLRYLSLKVIFCKRDFNLNGTSWRNKGKTKQKPLLSIRQVSLMSRLGPPNPFKHDLCFYFD